MSHNVAIAGATGAVGEEFLRVLEARRFPIKNLKLLASERSAGKTIRFMGQDITVQKLERGAFKGVDYALFSAGGSVSREFCPIAASEGAVVIDNSSAFRMDDNVPLVVPEINPNDAFKHKGIIANPNCTTIITLMAVAPLHRAATLTRLVISSYQSISGAGARAMAELEQQARDWAAGRPVKHEAQAHQILFNVYPHIDVFQPNGYTKEEMKLLHEGRKILGHKSLRASATCVRVPVLRCHSVSINAEFKKKLTPDEARRILAVSPGVEVLDDPGSNLYPMPLDRALKDDVAVGRIREDVSSDRGGLSLWAVGDQLAKGAALNAVQIAELLIAGPVAQPVKAGPAQRKPSRTAKPTGRRAKPAARRSKPAPRKRGKPNKAAKSRSRR